MKTLAIAAMAALMLGGCAQFGAESIIRIVEYEGGWMSFGGKGLAVHQSGKEHAFAHVYINYHTAEGAVVVDTKRSDEDGREREER